jgi:hypothetical protein
MRSSPQAGVVPPQAAASSGVHWTHVIEPVTSHTAVGALHCSFAVQEIGPGSSAQLSFSFLPGQ